jgi:hypothetical protein
MKVINGKNKLFFMFNYEGLVNNGVDDATFTIPQPEQFGGNFANLFDAMSRSTSVRLMIRRPLACH